MKTIIKLTLVLSLFCSVVLADGDLPGGNRQCPAEGCPPPPPCTENCSGVAQGSDEDTMTVIRAGIDSVEISVDYLNRTLDMLF